MDDKTTQLLTQLAEKLGVTVEYLWAVLIRQAQVEVVNDCIWYVLTAVTIFVALRYIPRWAQQVENAEYGDISSQATGIVAIIAVGLMTLIFLLGTLFGFQSTITKIRNPEYWALQQVQRTVK